MQNLRRKWYCFVAGALLFAGSIATMPGAQPVADQLAGSWRADISDAQALVLRFGQGSVEMSLDVSGRVSPVLKGKFTLPDGAKSSQMDWVEMQTGDGGPSPDNRCIYRVAGDTLLLIGGGPQSRPAKFYTGPGGEPRTLVFTRVEAEAKPAK